MADDRLKDTVLARADEDESLSERSRLVILAALERPPGPFRRSRVSPTSCQLVLRGAALNSVYFLVDNEKWQS